MMEKYITDEHTGLKYELVGDYYLIAGDDEPEEGQPIGTWGQRHLRYLKEHRRVRYANLLTIGKLNDYLADLNEQAEAMFSQLVKLLAEKEGVTEVLKAENQMLWVHKMNNLRNAAIFKHFLNPFVYRKERHVGGKCHIVAVTGIGNHVITAPGTEIIIKMIHYHVGKSG